MKKLALFVVLTSLSMFITNLDACTGIRLKAKDGAFVHGRTLEFGIEVNTSAAVIPRGFAFTGTTPQGPGLKYTGKYAAVGAFAFGKPALMDGMNEKGLAVGTFYFSGYASYAKITSENQSKALSPVDFSNWLLTQFATIDEIKSSLKNVVIAPTVISEWGPTPPPFHYVVYEKSGKSIAIEPRNNGELQVIDNPLGVFTNSPDFGWHMTNLNNFINLTPFNVKPVTIEGVTFSPFGQGSGMVGLPGDFSPPSRFVRAAIFSVTAQPSNNADEGVLQAFHILNQFDIPVGVARAKENGQVYTDYTLITCVRDPQSLTYYFKTYDDQTIKRVDLNKFDLNASTIKQLSTASKQTYVDISAQLK